MELGAVVVVPSSVESAACSHDGLNPYSESTSRRPQSVSSPRAPILGNDVLQLWVDRVRTLGVENLWLASGSHDRNMLRSKFTDLSRQGVEKVLVIKLKSYAEMDLADLLRFHCEKRNPVTDAQDARGSLGVSLLNRSALEKAQHRENASCLSQANSEAFYQFRGYTKRLLSSEERRDLVRDALTGACAIRPCGQEVLDQVWVAEDAVVDPSARILGPAYIGERVVIHSGATIGPFSSVEHDCTIDCGTTVERSSVLPYTHLGMGLLVQHSLVNGNQLEHLGWQAIVDLAPAGLGRKMPRSAGLNSKAPWNRRLRAVRDARILLRLGHSNVEFEGSSLQSRFLSQRISLAA